MADHLDSTQLVPFKRRRNGYHLPGLRKEVEEEIIDQVDPELRPEEQGFVRHYLAYADVLLKNAKETEEGADVEDLDAPNGDETAQDRGKVQQISHSNGRRFNGSSAAKEAA
ncbi:MAG TPA: hypothetical protein VKH81_17135 [Candidatus Angelobacter sp.]|nr:hypothetical protein [Candidatus Angelobacter sp.]